MGARDKLSSAHLTGSFGVAVVVAILSGSLGLGVIVFLGLLAADVAFGNVRTSPRRR